MIDLTKKANTRKFNRSKATKLLPMTFSSLSELEEFCKKEFNSIEVLRVVSWSEETLAMYDKDTGPLVFAKTGWIEDNTDQYLIDAGEIVIKTPKETLLIKQS